MPLTAIALKNAKPTEKPVKLFDGGGLYLLVNPNGSRWWRLKYRFLGKEKLLSLGTFPEVSIKDARDRRDDARKLLANGVDPSAHRQASKIAATDRAANSFESVAREWFAAFSKRWVKGHADKVLHRLEHNVFPWLGRRPIAEIAARELLAVLKRVEGRGALETAHRTKQNCAQVFRYAVATGRAERDPTFDLRGALAPVKQKHHASIVDPRGIGALLRAIDGYDGSPITTAALKLASMTFVRPGELRRAEWQEFDTKKGEWRIPAERMKMREQHIVPLSRQALAVLEELRPITGEGKYLFPGARGNDRPMSENTVNAALRRLGYSKDDMTGHGFRSMASTQLNEQGWNRDAIERQLAHAERDEVRAAYNFAEHLPERRRMMQAWSDHLDSLKQGAEVVPIRKTA